MEEQLKPKRKNTTSTEVKARYNKKTYSCISIMTKKELAENFRLTVKENGDTISEIFHKAINDYLEQKQNK